MMMIMMMMMLMMMMIIIIIIMIIIIILTLMKCFGGVSNKRLDFGPDLNHDVDPVIYIFNFIRHK